MMRLEIVPFEHGGITTDSWTIRNPDAVMLTLVFTGTWAECGVIASRWLADENGGPPDSLLNPPAGTGTLRRY